MPDSTLALRAVAVLAAADPASKVALSRETAAWWRGADRPVGAAAPPDRPGRPALPRLVSPGAVPRRRITSGVPGRVALLHALAHIELNAIDLAWDIAARFGAGLPREFADDWAGVAAEEAEHFALLADRLGALGAAYGDLPAHDGLWESALATADDLAARLAVVPLVLEARGLDVTPVMIARLEAVGDEASAAVLRRIYADEVGHVAVGRRWFQWVCDRDGADPAARWQALVAERFNGVLKPPFNDEARRRAGMPPSWYANVEVPAARDGADGAGASAG